MGLIGYNRMRFLCECLRDLDAGFRLYGGRLFVVESKMPHVLQQLSKEFRIEKITWDQDCEALYHPRDDAVKETCETLGIAWIERLGHTLWNPEDILEANGEEPPLTQAAFLQVATSLGHPDRPRGKVDLSDVSFLKSDGVSDGLKKELKLFDGVPDPADFGFRATRPHETPYWMGGECRGLDLLSRRLEQEARAFQDGICRVTQTRPNILAPATSLSPYLRFGCVSVRRMYWEIQDLYEEVRGGASTAHVHLIDQLIWREFFYVMSARNPHYDKMEENPICLNIRWDDDPVALACWEEGMTGYPLIDAFMRQLKEEGWIHHLGRNLVAQFLTRGAMWLSWVPGLRHFLRYQLDADWSVCSGNWMWISSSAFEKVLDCSHCLSPVTFGKRLEPSGEFVRRYVPELQNFPTEWIYQPWQAPESVQEKSGCVIGKDYPLPIVDYAQASQRCRYVSVFQKNVIMNLSFYLRIPE
ncbi:unnamed protein product [Cyprideis torosa]|uniref:Cryptochrome-1 n=1 Tax=Cyprideis torosa TaxID=163714 RepID=A0A7R8ZRU7_9CRUS|nr:unnamed protein product [Cyprideis torosa]CAG0899931.1 unnamed protein product [Cyprideis torosa]